jgi:hypothetical protein
MTRLFTMGWETGDVNEGAGNGGYQAMSGGTGASVTATDPAPRAGGGAYCLRLASSSSYLIGYKTFILPSALTDVWTRFAWYGDPTNNLQASGEWSIAGMSDATGAAQCSLSYDRTNGFLRLWSGFLTTQLAVTSATFARGSWHVIDWRTQITSGTVGVSEVWVNGIQVINFSGDNTASGTQANVQRLHFGSLANIPVPGVNAHFGYDDIAINDTSGTINNGRPGPGVVVLLKPSGAGSSTQLARGGTDTGANWSQCSEIPPSAAQYVGSATVGQRDLYALTDVPGGVSVGSINVVEAIALAHLSDAGSGSMGLTVKSGATINEASAQALAVSPDYYRARWEVDPNTGAAWTLAAVNAAEAGATVR